MKLQFYPKDAHIIAAFMKEWIIEDTDFNRAAWDPECDPLYLDCSPKELANCLSALRKEGYRQSVKRVFQGDHFYRSDTGRCLRCWRHRPELQWNNENALQTELCDRCFSVMKGD